jgi:hypothetical protein
MASTLPFFQIAPIKTFNSVRPKPRGGSTLFSSVRSISQIARNGRPCRRRKPVPKRPSLGRAEAKRRFELDPAGDPEYRRCAAGRRTKWSGSGTTFLALRQRNRRHGTAGRAGNSTRGSCRAGQLWLVDASAAVRRRAMPS